MKKYPEIIILAGPFIGDTLLLFSAIVFLKNKFKNIYFITYHNELISRLNPLQEIKVLNINDCKELLSSEKDKKIMSNHPGEVVINGKNLPLVIAHNAKNYELVDLYYRSKVFSKYKGKSYSYAILALISKHFNFKSSYKPHMLGAMLKKKLIQNKNDIKFMFNKCPFLTKKYIVLIEGTSMNAKKYNKWDELIDKLGDISNGTFHIVRIDDNKLPNKFSEKENISKIYCDLKYYPYIFLNQNCQFVLSTDTGLAHLSAMLAMKTFILYAISDPKFWSNGSKSYNPIIGSSNIKHIHSIQKNFTRLDPPDIRGEGFLTKGGFGVILTKIDEITNALFPEMH